MLGKAFVRRWQLLVLAGCLGLSGCISTPAVSPPAVSVASSVPVTYGDAVGIGHLGADGLTEASGLAASRQTAGVLWAVNDSGNAPLLFALNSRGEDLGAVRVAGVENIDWEDLASFTWQGKTYLLVADVGDNRALRPEVQLHVVPEPLPGPDGHFSGTVNPAWSIRLRFEDGPRDCEGVAVDAQAGQIWLLSKRTEVPVLYWLPLHPVDSEPLQTASRVATMCNIPPPDSADLLQAYGRFRAWPTAFDMRADGGAAVILTYKDAYLYVRQGREPWMTTLARQPQILPLPDADLLPQREAMCFAGDDALLVTSEGPAATLFRLSSSTAELSF